MFVAKGVQRKNGKVYIFYSLRKAVWDKQLKRQRQVYLAGLGPSKTISLAKAQAIAQKLGCSLDDLKRAGVRIAPAQRDEAKPELRNVTTMPAQEHELKTPMPAPDPQQPQSPPVEAPQRITEILDPAPQMKLSRGGIKPRSECVKIGNERLFRGHHYDIDYETGVIRITYLLWHSSYSKFTVSYEVEQVEVAQSSSS